MAPELLAKDAARHPPGRRAASASGSAIRRRLAACVMLVAPAAVADAASAQEGDTTRVVEIAEVVVTVVRAPLELHRTPHAVTSLVRRPMERALPGLALDEALRFVPGVQVDNRYNHALGERISVRGMGARAQFGVRGVKVLFDGIPATLPDGQTALSHVDPAFVHKVEVIRGPASGLWGNAAGGVVQLGTALPAREGARHGAAVTTGSDGLLRTGVESAGRSAGGAYILQASRLGYAGYREFNRARSLRAHGRILRVIGSGELELVMGAVEYDAQNPGSLSRESLNEAPHLAFPNNVNQQTGERGGQRQAGLSWRGPSAIGDLEWSGYLVSRSIENPIPPRIIDLRRSAGGMRASSAGARTLAGITARWSAGLEGELQRDDRTNHRNERGERGKLTLDQLERVVNFAGYGQLAMSGHRLTALAAVRHDWFRFSARDRLVTPDDPDDSGDRVLAATSPSVGVAFEASPRTSLYANATTSFETPTTTELANRPDGAGGFNPELDPQRAVSLEIGGRMAPWAGSSFELAIFRLALSDALVPYEIETAPGRQFFRNAGSALHRGFEASGSLRFGESSRFRGAYTFTDARFREFTVDGADHAGNRVPGVAPHRFDIALDQTASTGWSATVGAAQVSATPVDDANEHHAEPHLLLNARGTVPLRLGRVDLTGLLGIDNITDRAHVTSVVVNAFGGRYYEPGPGRSFYFGVTMRLPPSDARHSQPVRPREASPPGRP